MTVTELHPVPPVRTKKRHHVFSEAWTEQRREATLTYLGRAQEALRLRDWTITVDFSRPCDKKALATCTPMGDSQHATVRFSAEFVELTPALRAQTLLHELLHCHLFPLEDFVVETMNVVASAKANVVFEVGHKAHIERTVDRLADSFAGLLPPLEFP